MNTNRRQFINNSFRASLAIAMSGSVVNSLTSCGQSRSDAEDSSGSGGLVFSRIELPYAYNALSPTIDEKTMDIHYNKHHQAYVDAINKAVEDEDIQYNSEEDLLKNISKYSDKVRNNTGGAWNHNFFWECMTPNSTTPNPELAEALNGAFGSIENFKKEFGEAASGQFGSGWAWLISDNGTLKITSTPNQDNPLMDVAEVKKGIPLLGLDVWEHAYYLQYQNKRADYIEHFWNVVNWDKVAERMV